MRLLHTKRIELQEFGGKEVPQYAILSHTWGEEEITLQDIMGIKTNKATKLQGYEKVSKACSVAAANKFEYIWIDTCCIDKTSSAELSEALNSMYRWYEEAVECYAYLADVSQNSVNRVTGVTGPEFRESKWFTRGWTLQELIAPLSVIFLDKQWQEIGTKSDLHRDISEITGIQGSFLLGDNLRDASIAQRMSWASKRKTTRIEDLAYCLMGLFGIYMPMLYGEGERAFIRLQEEIIKVSDDHSLFAWRSIEDHGGILANSPAAFTDSGNIIPVSRAYATSSPSTLNSRGIHLSLRFNNNGQQGQGLAILHCTEIGKERMRFALRLRDIFQTNEDFVREQSTELPLIDPEDINLLQYPLTSLYIRQWHPTRNRKWEDMEKCVVKLVGVDEQEVTSRISNLDSNCELSDGLIIMNLAAIPEGILGRLVIVCKDGKFFQIVLRKHGKSLSADISTRVEIQNNQGYVISGKEQNDQDRIVKVLGDGQHIDVAIKKRVLLLSERRCLTEVVEISYSSSLKGVWLEHIAIFEKASSRKSLLSHAALRGLMTVVEYLLDEDSTELNLKYDLQTPLCRAAEGGQEAVVKYLLEKGAALDSKDGNGRTPLSWAAETGHEAIVRLLLPKAAVLEENEKEIGYRKPLSQAVWQRLRPAKGNKVEPKTNDDQVRHRQLETKDKLYRTPLFYAAEMGHETIVQLLIDEGAELDTRDAYVYGQTPLFYAARAGHEGVVKLLLDKGSRLDIKEKFSETPLFHATKAGHEAVVKLLLDKGAEVDTKNWNNQTPLFNAAAQGHEAIVKLLLDKGAELDTKDGLGQTTLFRAAAEGHEAVVKLLLDKGAEPDTKDSNSRTPLFNAAVQGHEAVVKLLLDKGAEPDTKDSNSRTPLFNAAVQGHEAIVKLLLDKGAEPDTTDSNSRTPLFNAAAQGHEAVVKLLLDKGAEVDTKNWDNQTPLFYAATKGHKAVVKLLLDKGAEPDTKDSNSQTPLFYAAKGGYEAIVKLLLDKGAEPDTKDSNSRTPLFTAAIQGHEAVVKLLLDKGAEPDTIDSNSRTPLFNAATQGHEAVVKLLLDKGAEVDIKNWDNQTPLFNAAGAGHEAVMKLLLDKGAKPDTKNGYKQTSIFLAAIKGHKAVVKLLLDKGVEPDIKDSNSQTPLFYAAKGGHEAVVKLLLDKGAEPDIKDSNSQTPLFYAAKGGHEAVVKLLLDKGAKTLQ